jgi:hypothetical protein
MSKTVVIGVLFVVAVLGFLIYSSMHLSNYRVEVCVSFRGRSECRTASADTQEHARRTAQTNACGLLASGVTDTMQCEQVEPISVKWLEKK